MINQEERFSRQKDLVPHNALEQCNVTVIGVGAVGRQVALQCAAMGVKHLTLTDHDVVEDGNLASQGYFESDLGATKVEATAALCRTLNSDINLTTRNSKFRKSDGAGNVVFCCVDKIEARRFIWDALKDKVDLFVDGRMSGETLRVLTAARSITQSMEHYPTTLFAQEQAHTGSCTAKTTIYCANIAAGFMLSKFALWLRRSYTDYDMLLNLAAGELETKG